ncbi:MAG: PLP-dependent cysteine synthase family protein [Armatimonadetes bacterium]|nr:PLP-dependent cysteine synthase family protein [Armatimonadota bacterium]MDW8121250.1 PLP-dependent cysteine synthase family protein [Armatimonadota bacterium]
MADKESKPVVVADEGGHRPSGLQTAGSVLDLIGKTPLVHLPALEQLSGNPSVQIYAKAEWFNPGGSVKDRPALYMIKDGEERGLLTKEKTILDSTSGNTGIAYSLIAAVKGYKVKLVVPANASPERKKMLLALGAEVIYSDPLKGSDGAIERAHQIYEEDPDRYYMPDQYNNPANPLAHYETTGPEIWEQTGGRVTHFVAGIGTSGTLIGTGKRLKEYNPDIEVIAVEPDAPFHGIEGLKHMASAIKPGIYDPTFPDRIIPVATEVAYEAMRWLAQKCGLLVGQSAGAAAVATVQLARCLSSGVIVAIFPDGGDRYLSSRVWDHSPMEKGLFIPPNS